MIDAIRAEEKEKKRQQLWYTTNAPSERSTGEVGEKKEALPESRFRAPKRGMKSGWTMLSGCY